MEIEDMGWLAEDAVRQLAAALKRGIGLDGSYDPVGLTEALRRFMWEAKRPVGLP